MPGTNTILNIMEEQYNVVPINVDSTSSDSFNSGVFLGSINGVEWEIEPTDIMSRTSYSIIKVYDEEIKVLGIDHSINTDDCVDESYDDCTLIITPTSNPIECELTTSSGNGTVYNIGTYHYDNLYSTNQNLNLYCFSWTNSIKDCHIDLDSTVNFYSILSGFDKIVNAGYFGLPDEGRHIGVGIKFDESKVWLIDWSNSTVFEKEVYLHQSLGDLTADHCTPSSNPDTVRHPRLNASDPDWNVSLTGQSGDFIKLSDVFSTVGVITICNVHNGGDVGDLGEADGTDGTERLGEYWSNNGISLYAVIEPKMAGTSPVADLQIDNGGGPWHRYEWNQGRAGTTDCDNFPAYTWKPHKNYHMISKLNIHAVNNPAGSDCVAVIHSISVNATDRTYKWFHDVDDPTGSFQYGWWHWGDVGLYADSEMSTVTNSYDTRIHDMTTSFRRSGVQSSGTFGNATNGVESESLWWYYGIGHNWFTDTTKLPEVRNRGDNWICTFGKWNGGGMLHNTWLLETFYGGGAWSTDESRSTYAPSGDLHRKVDIWDKSAAAKTYGSRSSDEVKQVVLPAPGREIFDKGGLVDGHFLRTHWDPDIPGVAATSTWTIQSPLDLPSTFALRDTTETWHTYNFVTGNDILTGNNIGIQSPRRDQKHIGWSHIGIEDFDVDPIITSSGSLASDKFADETTEASLTCILNPTKVTYYDDDTHGKISINTGTSGFVVMKQLYISTSTDYVFSFKVRSPQAGITATAKYGTSFNSSTGAGTGVAVTNTEWKTCSVTFNSSSNSQMYLQFHISGSNGQYVYIDDLKLYSTTYNDVVASRLATQITAGSAPITCTSSTANIILTQNEVGFDGNYAYQNINWNNSGWIVNRMINGKDPITRSMFVNHQIHDDIGRSHRDKKELYIHLSGTPGWLNITPLMRAIPVIMDSEDSALSGHKLHLGQNVGILGNCHYCCFVDMKFLDSDPGEATYYNSILSLLVWIDGQRVTSAGVISNTLQSGPETTAHGTARKAWFCEEEATYEDYTGYAIYSFNFNWGPAALATAFATGDPSTYAGGDTALKLFQDVLPNTWNITANPTYNELMSFNDTMPTGVPSQLTASGYYDKPLQPLSRDVGYLSPDTRGSNIFSNAGYASYTNRGTWPRWFLLDGYYGDTEFGYMNGVDFNELNSVNDKLFFFVGARKFNIHKDKKQTTKTYDWVEDNRYEFANNLGSLGAVLNYHKSLNSSNSLSNPQGLVSTQGINDGSRVFPFLVEEWPQVTCRYFEYDYPIVIVNKTIGQNVYNLKLWGDWNYLRGIEVNGMYYPDEFNVSNTSPSTFATPIPDELVHIFDSISWTRNNINTPYPHTVFVITLNSDWADQYIVETDKVIIRFVYGRKVKTRFDLEWYQCMTVSDSLLPKFPGDDGICFRHSDLRNLYSVALDIVPLIFNNRQSSNFELGFYARSEDGIVAWISGTFDGDTLVWDLIDPDIRVYNIAGIGEMCVVAGNDGNYTNDDFIIKGTGEYLHVTGE